MKTTLKILQKKFSTKIPIKYIIKENEPIYYISDKNTVYRY
uniref:Uncharacterized protein n=1 Tax=Meloidogyne enterolobii TaxID=390850 RepID=A0A6V7WDL3_MELEN|nr:unnamed protein product [Meloidogyne enterolobii]